MGLYYLVSGILFIGVLFIYFFIFHRKSGGSGRIYRDAAELVRGLDFFKNMGEANASKMVSLIKKADIGPGQHLCQEGDPGSSLYIVGKGQVNITKTIDGSLNLLTTLHAGSLFGEMSLLTGNPRSANAVTGSVCTMFIIEREPFDLLAKENPDLREAVWSAFAWNNFDNYLTSHPILQKIPQKKRRLWYQRGNVTLANMNDDLVPPEGMTFLFLVTGKIAIGSYEQEAPYLLPLAGIAGLKAARSARLIWFPPQN